MNKFIDNIENQKTTTDNGMKARITTANNNVDLFFQIGSSRNFDIEPLFIAAMVENKDLAIRILLYSRDITKGLGERETFKKLLNVMEKLYPEELEKIINKIPILGRWDDGYCFNDKRFREMYFQLIKNEIQTNPNSLVFKWLPRVKNYLKGKNNPTLTDKQKKRVNLFNNLIKFLGLTKEQYRKLCSTNTNVVEQQMCSNDWDNINYSHVPSVASSRYKNCFLKHSGNYKKYLKDLADGKKGVKINASAIFPHDVIGDIDYLINQNSTYQQAVIQQWNALPNLVGDTKILPMVDVSGSMFSSHVGNTNCGNIAVSLGLYLSDKNTGCFKDTFLTFTDVPKLLTLRGNIVEKIRQMSTADWSQNTDIVKAIELILNHAIKNNVSETDMPTVLLILSDMQFDNSGKYNKIAFKTIKKMYQEKGYNVPNVIFWNIYSHNNYPAKFSSEGVGLVSGYSANILSSTLGTLTPENIMFNTILKERYNWL